MAELNVTDVCKVRELAIELLAWVTEIESPTVPFAGGTLTVGGTDLSDAKDRANTSLASLQADVAALEAYS